MERIGKNRVFDGFCERNFKPDTDGWMDEQLEEREVPSVQIAKDILGLYDEVNVLRHENWQLRKRLEEAKKF